MKYLISYKNSFVTYKLHLELDFYLTYQNFGLHTPRGLRSTLHRIITNIKILQYFINHFFFSNLQNSSNILSKSRLVITHNKKSNFLGLNASSFITLSNLILISIFKSEQLKIVIYLLIIFFLYRRLIPIMYIILIICAQ